MTKKRDIARGIIDQHPWLGDIYDELDDLNFEFWWYVGELIHLRKINEEMGTKQIWDTVQNIINPSNEGIINLREKGFPYNLKVSNKTYTRDKNLRDTDNELPVDKIISGHNYITTEWENKGLILGIESPSGLTKENIFADYIEKNKNLKDIHFHKYTGPQEIYQKMRAEKNENVSSDPKNLEQAVLQDIIAGNAPQFKLQLIPNTQGAGYNIGIFYEDYNDNTGVGYELIGAMMELDKDGNKIHHVVSQEELRGASMSDMVFGYITSWLFDYNHENIRELYKTGVIDKKTIEGTGRMGSQDPMFTEHLSRLWNLLTTDKIGTDELKYAIQPLYNMMGKRLEKINSKLPLPERKDNLNEEEAQDVLIEFADSLDRGYKRQLKTEPARLLRTPVSWLSDLYHFHFNIREIWN